MAQLEFTAGPITSTLSADNTKAATAFRNAALHLGYTGDINDNQAVADFVMLKLRGVITNWSRQYKIQVDSDAARDAVLVDADIEFDD